MLTTIIKREILDHLKSAKFQIGFAVTLILMIVSTSINVRDYVQRQQDYLGARETIKVDPFFGKSLFRNPQVLSIFVQGKDSVLGNRLDYNKDWEIPVRPSGYMGEGRSLQDRLLSGFRTFDFAFVVRIILSLMAIFLAYDAVSGEKTQGTLKLVLSKPPAPGRFPEWKTCGRPLYDPWLALHRIDHKPSHLSVISRRIAERIRLDTDHRASWISVFVYRLFLCIGPFCLR